MMLSAGGPTARLDRLEKAGLIDRKPAPNDRRGVVVYLTARGLEIIDQAVGTGLTVQQRLLSGLSKSRRRELDSLLRDALSGIHQDPR